MTLYTIHQPGFDLTASQEPSDDYRQPDGIHFKMAQLLGWLWFVWSFPRLSDYDNPPAMDVPSDTTARVLWTLEVPPRLVKWCGLQALIFGAGDLKDSLFPSAHACRKAGDVPQGLIPAPIKPAWVRSVGSALPAFAGQRAKIARQVARGHRLY